jgi:hypothetical protein
MAVVLTTAASLQTTPSGSLFRLCVDKGGFLDMDMKSAELNGEQDLKICDDGILI